MHPLPLPEETPAEALADTPSALPSRAGRIGVLAALFLLAACSIRLLLARWVVDPDSFFHLASGRWIIAHHAIPTRDVLSWYGQAHGTRWSPHEWLFDLGIYLVWKLAGFQGVFAATAAVFGGAVLATRRLAELRGASWLRSLAVALVALAGMLRFVSPRPGTVTFLLLPLIAIMLERDRWLPALLLLVLGVNVHGAAYPIYLLVVFYYASPKKPWMMLAACALVLAQPQTFALLKYPFSSLGGLTRYIQEFQPTQLGAGYVFLGVLAASWLLLDREKVRPRDLVAAAVLLLMSLRAVRMQPYFYLLGLPLLAASFAWPSRWKRRRADDWDMQLPPLGVSARARDLAVLGGLLVCLVAVAARIPLAPIDADRGYPAGALAYVQTHGIERFWNEWNDGGYLMFRGAPPFVDGRADPFDSFFNPGTTLALDYMRSYRGSDDIRPLLRKYAVRDLIVHRGTALYRLLVQSRDFRLLYGDRTAAVFEYAPAGS